MVEWSITVVLKTTVPRGTGGSNPSLSASIFCPFLADISKALLDYFKVRYSKNDTLLCPFQGIFCFFIEYAAEGIAVVAYGKRIAILIVDNNHLIAFHLILRFLRLRH